MRYIFLREIVEHTRKRRVNGYIHSQSSSVSIAQTWQQSRIRPSTASLIFFSAQSGRHGRFNARRKRPEIFSFKGSHTGRSRVIVSLREWRVNSRRGTKTKIHTRERYERIFIRARADTRCFDSTSSVCRYAREGSNADCEIRRFVRDSAIIIAPRTVIRKAVRAQSFYIGRAVIGSD